MSVIVRRLSSEDWKPFRDLRLHALATEPGLFCSTYASEAENTEDDWRELLGGDDRRIFGLFDGERLVGITAAFTWREDPTRETAVLAMSFIAPEYRGAGLARLLYEARLEWIRSVRRFRKVVVSHRASNEPSRRANQRHGFVLVDRAPRTWPDGTTDDELIYALELSTALR